MLVHFIQNNVVINTVEQDTLDNPFGYFAVSGEGGIGWTWDGEKLVAPPPHALTPEQQREKAKQEREAAVANIKVTTAAGNTFDGDEISQGRMARAIIALNATGTPTVTWVLANNTVIQATVAELTEALALAGAAQAAIWVI